MEDYEEILDPIEKAGDDKSEDYEDYEDESGQQTLYPTEESGDEELEDDRENAGEGTLYPVEESGDEEPEDYEEDTDYTEERGRIN